ncbi:MAG: hypothetical protein ACPF8V_03225, partial [Luteibaculum sp.]
MPKHKTSFLFYALLAAILGSLFSWINYKTPFSNSYKSPIDLSGYDWEQIAWKQRQCISWPKSHIPEELDAKTQDGIYLWKTGAFWVKTTQSGDSLIARFKTLSRDFGVENEYSKTIAKAAPFKQVSFDSIPNSHPFTIDDQKIYVVHHDQVPYQNIRWLLLLGILISCWMLPFLPRLKVEAPLRIAIILFPPVFLSIPSLQINLIDLDNLVSPALYASFSPLYSYAHLITWLISLNLAFLCLRSLIGMHTSLVLYFLWSLLIVCFFPHLIFDGNLDPEINVPSMLGISAWGFWAAFLALLSPLLILLSKLYKPQAIPAKFWWLFLISTIAYVPVADWIGPVDLIHVLWPLAPLLFFTLKSKVLPQWLWLISLGILTLGSTYSIKKYHDKKIRVDAELLNDQILTNNNLEISHFLLREEWKRMGVEFEYSTDSSNASNLIQEHLLNGYLNQYQVAYRGTANSQGILLQNDSLYIDVLGSRFVLKPKEYYTEIGFPKLLSDQTWQVEPRGKIRFAQYKNGTLAQKSPDLLVPKRLESIDSFIRNQTEFESHVQYQRENNLVVSFYNKLSWRDFVGLCAFIVLLLSAAYLALVYLPNKQFVFQRLENRLRFAFVTLCFVTGIILVAIGYQNLLQQFKDQNAGF